MHRINAYARWLRCTAAAALLCTLQLGGASARQPAEPAGRAIPIHSTRTLDTDLAVTGLLSGLPQGATGYVRYADLASLPLISARIVGDENFTELKPNRTVVVTGVPLEVLARALRADRTSDLIDATCRDDYRAHYSSTYVVQHHPLLALKINGVAAAEWARQTRQYDLGPYFITHAHFVPAFQVLAHSDRPQVPSNVVRLNFSTTAAAFGALSPRGTYAAGSAEEQGFTIAKQNCLRCHNLGPYGGTKAARTWRALGTWAREQPAYFESYVKSPRLYEPTAKMPANPEYDKATLDALAAYFRTFADATVVPGH